MLIISSSEVERLLPIEQAIEVVAGAYSELSRGTADVPDRIGVSNPDSEGVTLAMPGFLAVDQSLAVKIVSVFSKNAGRGLPAIHALVLVFDPETGEPLAALEGASLTALRTGAACGLATKLLSRGDSSNVAVFGAGAQSRRILPAVFSVRDIVRVAVCDIDEQCRDRFVKEFAELFPQIEFHASTDTSEAVKNADIICAATTSSTPVFDGTDLKAGTHINGIGSFTPSMQELDLETVSRSSKIVVDSLDGALAEAGDILIAIENGIIDREDVYGEIGTIVDGSLPGRENDREITFFKSVGNAALDVAVGASIFKRAKASGIGVDVTL